MTTKRKIVKELNRLHDYNKSQIERKSKIGKDCERNRGYQEALEGIHYYLTGKFLDKGE